MPAQRSRRTEPGGLLLEGALDEVPVDAARRATDVALALLDHAASHHASQRPLLRVARRGRLLNVWLTDATCSTRCLEGSPQMSRIAGDTERDDERLFLNESAGGGVRVHWVLALPHGRATSSGAAPCRRDEHYRTCGLSRSSFGGEGS